jgi:hypothetical protein
MQCISAVSREGSCARVLLLLQKGKSTRQKNKVSVSTCICVGLLQASTTCILINDSFSTRAVWKKTKPV